MHQKQSPKDKEEQVNLSQSLEEQQETSVQDSEPDKFVGKTIDGRYEILGLAGKGGMSSVYRASHLLTQKIVALKLMHSHLLTDENAVRRFQQEAKAAGRLHHSNAISVQDMGVTPDGQPFLTMDYLDGRSLSEEIRDGRQIDPFRCIHIFIQICSALAHAHDQRIVHRDLKPSNVMLIQSDEDSDFVKVVDFGIAKILMEGTEALKLTATGDVFGSPYYMSPEQCMGNQLDARSDIYSMGCLMYEALTGNVPHEGKNVLETMYKHTNLAPPALTGIKADPRLTFKLDQILQKCMAKVPEQRYQSMIELRDDLQNLIGASQKGSKFAAKLGMKAAGEGRKFDNQLAAVSSKKMFWISVPLLIVLGAIVVSFGYYWISTSGDPSPADRELVLNRNISRTDTEEKVLDRAESQSKTAPDVLKTSLKMLGNNEQAHDTAVALYSALAHGTGSYTPEETYKQLSRYGLYFMKTGDYGEAIDAFKRAINVSVANNFANALENAYLQASMATCLMAVEDSSKFDYSMVAQGGTDNNAWDQATAAYEGFRGPDVTSAPTVLTNLGNLLELSSRHPEKLKESAKYLQQLIEESNIAPSVKAVAYYQAAQYANSCLRNGIDTTPLAFFDQVAQKKISRQTSTKDTLWGMLDGSLKAWELLERKRTIKRTVIYNEGVIYNLRGQLIEQEANLQTDAQKKEMSLASAASEYESALQKFIDINENEAAAKVLFNLSDIRLKQHDLLAYYENHRDAKRIWDGLLHPVNLGLIKKH